MTLPPTEGTQVPATTRPSTARRVRGQPARREGRPWPVTANALLLLMGAAGFVLMGALYLLPLGVLWPMTEALWNTQRAAVVTGFLFMLLAGLAFAAATSSATLRIGLSARTTSAFITRATTAHENNVLRLEVLRQRIDLSERARILNMLVHRAARHRKKQQQRGSAKYTCAGRDPLQH